MKHSLAVVLILCSLPLALASQEFRATLSGKVADASGAAMAGVVVTATNSQTGVKTQGLSNREGQYVIPFLAPGDYAVGAQVNGFAPFQRSGVALAANGHPVIDIRLGVRGAAQTVEVTASVPLVDTANGSVGQTVTTREVEDLPLNGRTPMMLAQLAVGVNDTADPTQVHPFDNNAAASWSIGGTPAQTSELLLDGAPDEIWSGSLAYSPPQDAVQEVTVQAFNTDAAYGHTIGGTGNQILKTGTNQLHGTAYEFTQPSNLGANSFFNNSAGVARAVTHFNQYGLTLGGPLVIPKVVDGHNQLFWFFAWENLSDSQPATDLATVPTDAERTGDFSALLALGPQYQIYNPMSGVLNGKSIDRTAFSNNIIPGGMINKVAQAYLQLYPEPNTTGTADGADNFISSAPSNDSFNNELGRVDYAMGPNSKLSVDLRHNYRIQAKQNFFSNVGTGSNLTRANWGTTADEVYTLSPSLFLDVRGNWTYMGEVHSEPSAGFDPTQLGYPSYMTSNSEGLQLPFIGFSGSCGSQTSYQCLGNTGASRVPSQSYQFFTDLLKNSGNHSVRFGVDLRRYRMDAYTQGNSAGSFTFNSSWTQGPTAAAAAAPFGQDLAAFLLGLPSSGTYDLNAQGEFVSMYYAGFVQDDWRVSPNLTLNLGLRYDHDSPYEEPLGAAVNGFDFTAPNPVAAAAQLAYAASPIPQLAAANFQVPGGLTFASVGSPGLYRNQSHLFSPRLGFAWSPASMQAKTVVRGGIATFVGPITPANLASTGTYSSNPIVDQEGYSQSTPFVATNNNFLSPATTLSDPFPGGAIEPALGATAGLATFNGQTVSFLSPVMRDPYSIRWNFGVQQQLRPNTMLEVDYVGNHGVHLPIAVTQLNGLPLADLSTLPTRDQNLINTLSATVANPFANLLPGSSLNGSKVSVAQLLSNYPEFPSGEGSTSAGVLEQNATEGSSYFESLDARVEQRMSHGLTLIGNYMYSKLMEADSYLNDTDLTPNLRISPFDHTEHFVAGFTYALPLGRGMLWNLPAGWLNAALGGWTTNGIYTFETGAPIVWTSDMVYNGTPLDVQGHVTNGAAFNLAAFDTNSKDQFQYHLRTFPSTFQSWRQDGINNFDFSLLKNIPLGERANLELRFEGFNLLNHADFAAPNVSPTAKTFGLVTSQSNLPRAVQLGVRIVF